MPVFKLTPVQSRKDDERWLATAQSETCWINERDADAARRAMEGATLRFVDRQEGRPMTIHSPWLDNALVQCERDDSKSVPEGHYVTASGRVYTL
jgi:hypothetical protein